MYIYILEFLIDFFNKFFLVPFALEDVKHPPYKLSKCQCDAQNSKGTWFCYCSHRFKTIQEVGQVLLHSSIWYDVVVMFGMYLTHLKHPTLFALRHTFP
jgi:hypothetical protein